MIILKENVKSFKESNWSPSTKDELFSTIKKSVSRQMSLYVVGPDWYLIQDALVNRSAPGVCLLSDSNGLIVGFSASDVGSRIEKMVNNNSQTIFSFFVGRMECQLIIE